MSDAPRLPGNDPSAASSSSPQQADMTSFRDATRVATAQLRSEAKRRQRRNRLLGRIVALCLVAGLAAAGYVGYRAYQDDQDQRDAARNERDLTGQTGDDTAGAGPLGNLVEVIETQDAITGAAGGPSGALVDDLVADAQAAVDQANGIDPAAPTAPAATPSLAEWSLGPPTPPDHQQVAYLLAVYDQAGALTEHRVSYDTEGDRYAVSTRAPDGTVTNLFVDDEWAYAVAADGSMQRWSRSTASLDPEADLVLAQPLGVTAAVPDPAGAYATARARVDDRPAGAETHLVVYDLSLDQFRATGTRYDDWVVAWNDPALAGAGIIDEATRERRGPDRRYIPAAFPFEDPQLDPSTRASARAAAELGDDGLAHAIVIVSPDVMVAYVLLSLEGTAPAIPDFPDDGWRPA